MMYRGEEDGITWDHDDYTPHVTITYEAGAIDLEQVKPYVGELKFGPEIFEEIKGPTFVPTEDGNHGPDDGRFVSSPANAGTRRAQPHFPGATNAEKIANAEATFGTDSPQHKDAIRRFGKKVT